MKQHRLVLAAAALVLVAPLVSTAQAAKGGAGGGGGGGGTGGTGYTTSFKIPLTVQGWVTEDSWCDNKGPHITINTGNIFGGFAAELTFANNLNDRSVLERVGAQALEVVGDGTSTTESIWKQPSRGGAGGNPFIYVDPDGLAGPEPSVYIGRCVQDGKIGQLNHGHWSVDSDTLATSTLTASALECSNKTSYLTIGTDTSADSTSGNLIFSNSDLGLNPQHINDSDIAVSWAFNNGTPLRVRKGGGATGAGGNPLVSTEFGTIESVDANSDEAVADGLGNFWDFEGFTVNGVPNATYKQLGRCNKI